MTASGVVVVPSYLPDLAGIGVLTRMYPPSLVNEVVAECGRTERRRRLLPARLVVYFLMAMALFSPAPYLEVMRHLVEGLRWADLWGSWHPPSKAAIFRARQRLGVEPMAALFRRCARPLATEAMAGAFWRGRRLMALDGSYLDIADTAANAKEFTRPGTGRGEGTGSYPQVLVVVLVECGTHAVVDAALGSRSDGELRLAQELMGSLAPGMLVLGDRNLPSSAMVRAVVATGADLCFRIRANRCPPVLERLEDGSWRSELHTRQDREAGREPVPVRALRYRLEDPGRPAADDEDYLLVTTLLDPRQAPAAELAALYAQRWECESVLDEIKTHQRGPRTVLASKAPAGVRQEIYAHLLVHYALRAQIAQALAEDTEELGCNRGSFTTALRAARRTVTSTPGVFSP
ncbi:IS4 family transposase [Streptomyces spectabilis]|uniref:IS4 family transposase n=1 Tax=Streptomyces spectabilis TaxID=68270 RepID=UPI003403779E